MNPVEIAENLEFLLQKVAQRKATETLTTKDPGAVWKALSKDIHSVQTFFDQIILADHLPLIDYGETFDSALGYDTPRVCQIVNEELQDKFVYTVHVYGDASAKAREAAVKKLTTRPAASPELRQKIVDQLDVMDYEWRPDVGELQRRFPDLSEDELKLARFMYGSLLFNAFCQMSGGTHVLPGQRGRLATTFALDFPDDTAEQNDKLLAELNRRIQERPEYVKIRIETLSSFLPLLLRSNPKDPRDLLRAAKELRSDEHITQYRNWYCELLHDWVDNRRITRVNEEKVALAAQKIRHNLGLEKPMTIDVGIDVGVHDLPKLTLGVKGLASDRIWGWVFENLGGHRYLKVLADMSSAAREFPNGTETALKTLWHANQEP